MDGKEKILFGTKKKRLQVKKASFASLPFLLVN
jgi:hypothetical protein